MDAFPRGSLRSSLPVTPVSDERDLRPISEAVGSLKDPGFSATHPKRASAGALLDRDGKAPWGRHHASAQGASRRAARLRGIPEDRSRVSSMLMSGSSALSPKIVAALTPFVFGESREVVYTCTCARPSWTMREEIFLQPTESSPVPLFWLCRPWCDTQPAHRDAVDVAVDLLAYSHACLASLITRVRTRQLLAATNARPHSLRRREPDWSSTALRF